MVSEGDRGTWVVGEVIAMELLGPTSCDESMHLHRRSNSVRPKEMARFPIAAVALAYGAVVRDWGAGDLRRQGVCRNRVFSARTD